MEEEEEVEEEEEEDEVVVMEEKEEEVEEVEEVEEEEEEEDEVVVSSYKVTMRENMFGRVYSRKRSKKNDLPVVQEFGVPAVTSAGDDVVEAVESESR
ncbi:unnamed protein product, partial [Linum tenue]